MKKIALFLLSLFSLLSCDKSIDFDAEKSKIIAQIQLVDQAHHDGDANLFFQPNAESWHDVRSGLVTLSDKKMSIEATQSYLDKMEFIDLIHRQDPIIEISQDASLASYIGAVAVKGVLDDSPVFFAASWQSVFKKIDGVWKIVSSANTEADDKTSVSILLELIRERLGNLNDKNSLYAYAECTAPEAQFKTLILSNKTNGKMEQIYGNHHVSMAYSSDSIWGYDLNLNEEMSPIDQSTKTLIQGHELHWLSFYPEHKHSNPTYRGITEFQDEMAFEIEFSDLTNKSVTFFYSFESYLPLGFNMSLEKDRDSVAVHYEQWEILEGVKVFKKAILQHGDEVFEYKFLDMKFNGLDPEDFESRRALLPSQ